MVVAFFGHKDTPSAVKPLLEQTVQRLIEENEEITFLVGTHGAFDLMVQSVLGQALQKHPHITCHIVLSYIPVENNGEQHPLPTLVPEGIESVPKRFAISFGNNYMVNECDTVVCYITHDWGGAAQFVNKAKKKGKTVINLAAEEKR
ncbi:MAG: hypothetical protein ACI4JY_09970 [Oscillospiraceae bacterium]